LKALDPERPIREADKGGFWPAVVCPLLTQLRHWLCTAAMVLTGIGRQLQTYMPRRPRWIASSTAFIVGHKHKIVYSLEYISNTFSIYHNNDLLTLILLTL